MLALTKGGRSSIGNFASDPLGHGAIQKGVEAQAAATDRANALMEKMYNQQRADAEPWRAAGIGALSDMGNADFKRDFKIDDFQKDPGYDFRMQEGTKALERSAAARGARGGGATMKALAKYGQDYASNEYGNAYNRFNADRDRRFGRLSSIAGMGQTATAQNIASAGNYGNNVSQNYLNMGNARAAGGVAQANSNQMLLSGLTSMGSKAMTGGA